MGIRSTRIRTSYDSIVTIPNSEVAGARIDNLGRRRRRRFKSHLTVAYDTTAAQMEAFVEGIRATVAGKPDMYQDTCEVHFHQMSSSSLDVLVYVFILSDTWSGELAMRQALMLEWMRLAADLEIEFAYPTNTTHIASLPKGLVTGRPS